MISEKMLAELKEQKWDMCQLYLIDENQPVMLPKGSKIDTSGLHSIPKKNWYEGVLGVTVTDVVVPVSPTTTKVCTVAQFFPAEQVKWVQFFYENKSKIIKPEGAGKILT